MIPNLFHQKKILVTKKLSYIVIARLSVNFDVIIFVTIEDNVTK